MNMIGTNEMRENKLRFSLMCNDFHKYNKHKLANNNATDINV